MLGSNVPGAVRCRGVTDRCGASGIAATPRLPTGRHGVPGVWKGYGMDPVEFDIEEGRKIRGLLVQEGFLPGRQLMLEPVSETEVRVLEGAELVATARKEQEWVLE